MKFTRRQILKAGLYGGAGMMLPWRFIPKAHAITAAPWLYDPDDVQKFALSVPDAMAPGFKFAPVGKGRGGTPLYRVGVTAIPNHQGGLGPGNTALYARAWGYDGTWPGKTFEVQSGRNVMVQWENNLFGEPHLLPVDTNLHWCYSLHGYENFTIANDGVPIVTHLHGGHSQFRSDGNPEQFISPGSVIKGPHWRGNTAVYQNDQGAGNLWYHDHALGITRLNVYAGLAGFYFIRDEFDTGLPDNPLGLPAWPYEKAYAIQDRMFDSNGQLFYPAFPGDPFYDDFIFGEIGEDGLPEEFFPGGGPTALAEFFGDHMIVNGKAWPKEDVEPRNYRMHLLNGTDSRFMVIRFRVAASLHSTDLNGAGTPLPFYVIGSDQGLAGAATMTDTLVFEPGSRYDIVFDFKGLQGNRIIMENIGGDEPFGGTLVTEEPALQIFGHTNKVMAFDVANISNVGDSFDPSAIGQYGGNTNAVDRTRKVALFEGLDEFGRLQPLLGTVADDLSSATAYPWHLPTTENPDLNATEVWEIYNFTGDAHPIHLHLVNFQIMGRNNITFIEGDPVPVLQHNGTFGQVAAISKITEGSVVNLGPSEGYLENAPKDMFTALPEQVTRIKATFDRPGRYVWHCHILSHEDHEMMRVLHIGGGA